MHHSHGGGCPTVSDSGRGAFLSGGFVRGALVRGSYVRFPEVMMRRDTCSTEYDLSVIYLDLPMITLRAKLSGAVYCYRSCLWACLQRAGGTCYHDNSKSRALIFTKMGLSVQVVTFSS